MELQPPYHRYPTVFVVMWAVRLTAWYWLCTTWVWWTMRSAREWPRSTMVSITWLDSRGRLKTPRYRSTSATSVSNDQQVRLVTVAYLCFRVKLYWRFFEHAGFTCYAPLSPSFPFHCSTLSCKLSGNSLHPPVRSYSLSVCRIRLRNDLYCVEWGVKLYSLLLLSVGLISWL